MSLGELPETGDKQLFIQPLFIGFKSSNRFPNDNGSSKHLIVFNHPTHFVIYHSTIIIHCSYTMLEPPSNYLILIIPL